MKLTDKIQQLTATQRIENLENAAETLINSAQHMLQENAQLKQRILDLEMKMLSVINNLELNDKIAKDLVDFKVDELKERVSILLERGEIEKDESVGPTSLVVSKESDKDGNVTTERVQFLMEQITDGDLKVLLIGKTVGEKIEYKDSLVEILEIYKKAEQTA